MRRLASNSFLSWFNPHRAREVAVGRGNSSRPIETLMPIPMTACGPAGPSTRSERIPHTLPPWSVSRSTSTSLGHFSVTRERSAPPTSSMTLATASPATIDSQPQSCDGRSLGTNAEIAKLVPGTSCQLRVNRPRPPSWWSATSRQKDVPPARTKAAMSALVEPVESMQVTPPPRGPVKRVSPASSRTRSAIGEGVDGTCSDYPKVPTRDGRTNAGFPIVILNRYVIAERDDRSPRQ